MSYYKNRSGNSFPNKNSSLSTNFTSASNGVTEEFYELEAGEVLDVIRTSEHESFDSFLDIGKAKVRLVHSQFNRKANSTPWAKPMNPNVKSYPVNHETVVVGKYFGELYYVHRINFLNNVNHNENTWVSVNFDKFNNQNSQDYEKRAAGVEGSNGIEKNPKLGDTFKPSDDIKPLEHKEGDVIFEGRFGNSIRFGSNPETLKPIIKIRAGQFEKASDKKYLEPVEEDINKDASSIYLAEDQTFELKPSTKEMDSHYFSVDYSDSDPPEEFKGKQIIANTDRIVLNTKVNQFITYSKKSTHMLTEKDFTQDIERDMITKVVRDRYHETEGSYVSLVMKDRKNFTRGNKEEYTNGYELHSVGDKVVIEVPESFLVTAGGNPAGSSGSVDKDSGSGINDTPTDEPFTLGMSLAGFLKTMIDWIDKHQHPTPVGPTGPPMPPPLSVEAQATSENSIDQQINSDNHYLTK